MAAFVHSRAGSRTSIPLGEQELPNGSCNYRDLSIGSRAPICGCTRFWLNVSHFSAQDGGSERAWCFCGHHACFHNTFSQQQRAQQQALATGPMSGAQNERALQDNGYNAVGWANEQQPSTLPKPLNGLGIHPGSRSQSQTQSINTRVWRALNDFARNQADGETSNTTSKLPSTAAPSLIEEPRLSPNPFVEDRLQHYRAMAPPVQIPSAPMPGPAEEYSATEVATPSIAGTPDFRAMASSSTGQRTSPGHLQPSRIESRPTRTEPAAQLDWQHRTTQAPAAEQQPATYNPAMSSLDIQNFIRTYGQRLEVLESLSFSQVPVEELQERFEVFDGRILDLEQWRADQDQSHVHPEPSAAPRSKRRRLLPNEIGSFASEASDASFDSSAAAHAETVLLATLAANAETNPRIDALENRVNDLENAAMPSYAHPWHVQVVLLPWGRDLRGIWFSAADATQRSMKSTTQNTESEWTGAQSGPKLSFKSSTSGAWTTESIQAWANEAQEWLSPKACGPNGTVFQRLASRGLVQDVILTTPDARHIMRAINDAFGQLLKDETPADETEDLRRYQCLRETFIPLRKARKSARLRFLSPSEMITSANWTAAFLESSVFMKVNDGQRRLYVTTPQAYMQEHVGTWAWKRLRALPIFNATAEEQAAQAQNVAIEACWTYNDQLDHVSSAHSSFASHGSQWSTRSQAAVTDDPDRQPMSPRSEVRILRQRPSSLPSSSCTAEKAREILPKRRVASFEPVATIPITANEHEAEISVKRRRISTSPEAERRGVNFTPRWSREPPSPFTSEAAAEARSQATSSRKRGTTPFAYATPHSNSNFVARMDLIPGDGDTEADTDIGVDHSERGEEEWEGVDDGMTNQSDGESIMHEQDVNEDDLEEGLTIYES
ncbi:hypothetical protein LTR37_005474 [Vermiconidia calcicola]|uniref:Uncharacterized protein n=1 Tax=Vermiconidia calcicola TaxID=1690605 RepID=A0ACC3NJT0_9PEZI|nr:hypothetical protein LTR37_005474 [Vermiconidia calcicola]